jgi:hypothetical protein
MFPEGSSSSEHGLGTAESRRTRGLSSVVADKQYPQVKAFLGRTTLGKIEANRPLKKKKNIYILKSGRKAKVEYIHNHIRQNIPRVLENRNPDPSPSPPCKKLMKKGIKMKKNRMKTAKTSFKGQNSYITVPQQ